MYRKSRFFTLIELLVVIAIIGILASILLPSLQKAKKRAAAAECQSSLRQIGIMIATFCGDFRGCLPFGGTWVNARGGSEGQGWHGVLNATVGGRANPQLPLIFYNANSNANVKTSSKVLGCPELLGINRQKIGNIDTGTLRIFGINRDFGQDMKGALVTSSTTDVPIGGWTAFTWGKKAEAYKYPDRTLSVGEIWMGRDIMQQRGNEDFGGMAYKWGKSSAGYPPEVLDDGYFRFAHDRAMNILFLDAHVQRMRIDSEINTKRRFYTMNQNEWNMKK